MQEWFDYECGCGFKVSSTEKIEALREFIKHYESCECDHHANTDPMRCHLCSVEFPQEGYEVFFKVMIDWKLETSEDFELTHQLSHITEKYDFDLEGGGAGSGFGMRDEDWCTKYIDTAEAIFEELKEITKEWKNLNDLKLVRITMSDDHEDFESETLRDESIDDIFY